MDILHLELKQSDVLKKGVLSAISFSFSIFFLTIFSLFLIHILQGGLFVKVYKSAQSTSPYSPEFSAQRTQGTQPFMQAQNLRNQATNTNLNNTNINSTNTNQQLSRQQLTSASPAQSKPVLPKRIKIPSLSKNLPVLNPKSSNMQILDEQLLHGTVRYPKTATLDMRRGNMLIFGHSSHLPVVRNKMFRAFNDIEKLKKGSKIIIEGDNGKEYVYQTRYIKKVSADNSSVLIDTDNKQLTLITCENFGSKQDRWVLVADFVEER